MATEEEVQALAEGLSDDISAAIAGLGLDQAIQVLQVVQDRVSASLSGIRDDYQLAISNDAEEVAALANEPRHDQLDEGGQLLPTVEQVEGPADLMDLEREVGKK